ncbi:MAG: hypothetical protein QMD85_02105 [Candidatus Aenigmarchaeota archaeon]|nr:hypothetical protein [Candidatus Aenigmarchaeota archaeon]MDI6722343.1 hypothetical protein [Candidatus Aenigmarchaeota archaeon]
MIKLSPSSLNNFIACPKCFWLSHNKGIRPPDSIVASITNGLDRVIKEYMNRYRPKGIIPPFLEGKVPGRLIEYLPAMTSCKIDDNIFNGRLDECLVLEDGLHAPLDHKSKGFEPRDNNVHETHQFQMDCYTLLLRENGHNVSNTGYLVYYYPSFGELHNGIPFKVHAVRVRTDPEKALKVFREAVKCLQNEEPAPGRECGLCEYVRERNSADLNR